MSPRQPPRRFPALCALALLFGILDGASARAHKGAHHRTSPVTPREKAAYEAARPVFEKHCFRCHTAAGAKAKDEDSLEHLTMDTYPFGGHHEADIARAIRKVLAGKKPKMPGDERGAVKGSDLERILVWASEVDKAMKKTASGAGGNR